MSSVAPNVTSSYTTTTTSINANNDSDLDNSPLWDMNSTQVERWIRTTNTLFPKAPTPTPGTTSITKEENDLYVKKSTIGSILLKKLVTSISTFLQESQKIKQDAEVKKQQKIKEEDEEDDDDDDDEDDDDNVEQPKKRIKTEQQPQDNTTTKKTQQPNDTYKIFVDKGDSLYNDEIPDTFGGILVELSIGGLVNALAGIPNGGLVINDKLHKRLKITDENAPLLKTQTGNITISYKQILTHALLVKRAINVRSERDVLTTTPIRIQQMLCPDLKPYEFSSIRRRIYDTVILGQGRKDYNSQQQAGDDELSKVNVVDPNIKREHDIEKFKKCKTCGNNNQSDFVLDRKNGDVVCTQCGTVATESLMHEGSQYRKFEGEVDRNHHGDVANPLYSNARNTSTSLGGVQFTSSAGGPGWGSQQRGGGRNLENILRNAHAYTELNISQFGSSERKTRIGYKDKQKTDAFIQMSHIGDALNLNEAVVQRSKEIFSGFRDDRELVQQYMGVIAACLCEAFDELTKDGKNILKQMEKTADVTASENTATVGGNVNAAVGGTVDSIINKRASKRKDLHSSKLAGKGGLQLDYSKVIKEEDNSGGGSSSDGNNKAQQQETTNGNNNKKSTTKTKKEARVETAVELKPAATWTLDDCRTWLFEVSDRIAKQWHETKEKRKLQEEDDNNNNKNKRSTITNGGNTTTSSSSTSTTQQKIPDGNREEMEGKLVEHALTLCDHLENELKNASATTSTTSATNKNNHKRQRVVTPRVQGMGSLSIKWQHSHERGSGGKGGVGNSGYGNKKLLSSQQQRRGAVGAASSSSSSRTAGQIFILKTSKKLSDILNGDTVFGDAFHKELRLLLDKQRERKRLEMRNEATKQRLLQMKRKPWLQARIEQQSTTEQQQQPAAAAQSNK